MGNFCTKKNMDLTPEIACKYACVLKLSGCAYGKDLTLVDAEKLKVAYSVLLEKSQTLPKELASYSKNIAQETLPINESILQIIKVKTDVKNNNPEYWEEIYKKYMTELKPYFN